MSDDYIYKEILRAEKKRLEIFLAVLIFTIMISLILQLFYQQAFQSVFRNSYSYTLIFSWAMIMSVGFIVNRRFIIRSIHHNIRLGKHYFWCTTLFEFLAPASWLVLGSYLEQSSVLLESPVILIYFILIIVSSLHLNFKLSMGLGVMVAVFYACFSTWAVSAYPPAEGVPQFSMILYYMRSVIFLFAGLCAAFVAMELRRRLNASFNQMREKQHLESLFSQHVPKEIVEALKEKKDFAARMNVTVMFLDIRNFTRLVQRLSPEEVNEFQNQFFGPVIDIINKHYGIVHQILGDGLMATFGAPIALPNHQVLAWEAAQAIDHHVRISGVGYTIDGALKIGIGMHTGDVLVGNIGTEARKQFSVSGINVIIASRLEQQNKELDASLLITKTLFDALGDLVTSYDFIRKIRLKGLDEEIEVVKIK